MHENPVGFLMNVAWCTMLYACHCLLLSTRGYDPQKEDLMKVTTVVLGILAVACLFSCTGEGFDSSLLLHKEMDKMDFTDAKAYIESPEYHDVCTNAYSWASFMLHTVKDGVIVMDLDQTVLAGLSFNTWLVESGQSYSFELQLEFLRKHDLELMPGALEFIQGAESRGFVIMFVTNRKPALTTVTEKNLAHHGLGHISVTYRTAESDKSTRLEAIPEVVMTIGDKDNDHMTGVFNVLLPNPLY